MRDEKVIASLPLPIAGLMSDQTIEVVSEKIQELKDAAKTIGSTLSEPFMTMAFLSLPVIPKLKITDLGLVDVDVFAVGLNYVFGEAYLPGRASLVSIWRLRPEFYGERADSGVFGLRILKEAVHELGHTLGLKHCSQRLCVMHFSNSIFDTDRKQSLLCSQCYLQAALAISRLGKA